MVKKIKFPDGFSLYLLNKLTKFDKIFCKANQNNLIFMCANNYLSIRINNKIAWGFNDFDFQEKWSHKYVFDAEEVRRNVRWFKIKPNAKKKQTLFFELEDDLLKFYNNEVCAEIKTLINNPPVHEIPLMEGGDLAQIPTSREMDIRTMIEQVNSITEEVIKIELTESELIISGKDYSLPTCKLKIKDPKINDRFNNHTTLCYKAMLKFSCQLAREIGTYSPYITFYPGGATQIYGGKNNISFRSSIVAIK